MHSAIIKKHFTNNLFFTRVKFIIFIGAAILKKKILIYNRVPKDLAKKIAKNFKVTMIDDQAIDAESNFLQALSETHGVIGGGREFNSDSLKLAKNLEVISNISVGYDNCDVKYLSERKIMLTNTPNVLNETTADLALALLLSTARRVPELDKWTKSNNWKKPIDSSVFGDSLFGYDIHGKTIGIIGLGKIGKAIARRARFGFNMNIIYSGRTRHKDQEKILNAKHVDLKTLYKEADFICPVVPLSDSTKNMINESSFNIMKKNAILINVSRGAIVNENDLINALKNNKIAGAGLDVYSKEPLEISELFEFPNVVTLPHIGSATHDTRRAMAVKAIDNLCSALNGNVPIDLVNRDVFKI